MPKRKLISDSDVRRASKDGQSVIQISPATIITPLARDAARQLGISFSTASAESVSAKSPAESVSANDGGSQCGCKHTDRAIVAVGSDHGGFAYKQDLAAFIAGLGWEVLDVGTDSETSCDYPEFAYAVALAVRDGRARLGIMIDGAGPGSAIACNKVPGIRAACVHDEFTAWNARAHNNAHVMTLGSRSIGIEVARRATKVFLESAFEGGRHETRVAKISDIERKFQAVAGKS